VSSALSISDSWPTGTPSNLKVTTPSISQLNKPAGRTHKIRYQVKQAARLTGSRVGALVEGDCQRRKVVGRPVGALGLPGLHELFGWVGGDDLAADVLVEELKVGAGLESHLRDGA
jgi:hypothetical protein